MKNTINIVKAMELNIDLFVMNDLIEFAYSKNGFLCFNGIDIHVDKMGDENAYNLLGTMYEMGCGVKQDFENAIKYYKLAAENGIEIAYLNIGAFYQFGCGVPKDERKAVEYYQYGANTGNMYCLNALGMQYTFLPTGAQIIFRGLDDSAKLKSIKPKKGVFRYVWFEEFSELPGANFTRSVMQSVVRGNGDFTVFRSFNPPLSKSNWANQFIADTDSKAITLHTSYLDVPSEWLGESFIYEAERLKEVNESAYRHEYLGEAVGSGGEVFPNIEVRTITDREINELQYIYAGLDFGFAVDPAAFIRVAYDKKHDAVYFLNEIFKRHCSNAELAELIKNRGLDHTGRTVMSGSFEGVISIAERQTIICDSAEPKSIADLRAAGLKVLACSKYPGSVLYGIKWLQHRKLIIDPKRTPNVYREFTQYEYCTTKDGEFLSDVPDKDNHTIDATRYALERLINRRGISA